MRSLHHVRLLPRILRLATIAIVAIGLAGFAHPAFAAMKVTEEDVVIRTPDGQAEAALLYPAEAGTWPEIILWPDFVGLRPLYRDLARRLASEGFVVLVPNSFYRSRRLSDAELDPRDPTVRPELMRHRGEATAEGIARDAAAYLAFLDAQPQSRGGKVGTVGYDLGGSYAFRTAAALPDRVTAVATIYPLGAITDRPDSPHRLIALTKAAYHIVITRDDDVREPEDLQYVRDIVAETGLSGNVMVVPADHGFANPAEKTYDEAAARREFDALVAFLTARLN